MRASGVIVRFLALLDVTLCLLGVLKMWVFTSHHRVVDRPLHPHLAQLEGLPLGFVPLYGGTYGEREGKIFVIEKTADGKSYKLGPQVYSRAEVDTLAGKIAPDGKEVRVLLLLSDLGFDRVWTEDKIQELSQKWEREVVVVRQVHFPLKT